MLRLAGLLLLIMLCQLAVGQARAFEKLDGCFTAENACPALLSIRKQSNPEGILLEPGTTYKVLGRNARQTPTHFQLRVPGARPERRWIDLACGTYRPECAADAAGGQVPRGRYILAVSWQPAFCETHQQKPECLSQTQKRFDASHFTLHGLWPQPRERAYCGVDPVNKAIDRRGKWHLLPALAMSEQTRRQLNIVMPGTRSFLQRHEWIKHGTCFGAPPEAYYTASLQLMEQLNRSQVRVLFADTIGNELTVAGVRRAFTRAFGPSAGRAVGLRCKRHRGRQLITGLHINLAGEFGAQADLAGLLRNAAPAGRSCRWGFVDRAGVSAP